MKFELVDLCSSETNAAVGYVVDLLLHTDRRGLSIASVDAFLMPAVRLKQVAVGFCAYRKIPRAFLTYAFLTNAVLEDINQGSDRILDISEWNEGDNLFITDIVAPFGSLPSFLARVSDQRFQVFSKVSYRRRRPLQGQGLVTTRPLRRHRQASHV